jgi:hypothetical protein
MANQSEFPGNRENIREFSVFAARKKRGTAGKPLFSGVRDPLKQFDQRTEQGIFSRLTGKKVAVNSEHVSVHFSHTFPALRKHDLFSLSICK